MVGRTNILPCRTIPALLIWFVYRICAVRTLDPLIEFEHPRTHRGTAPGLRKRPFRLNVEVAESKPPAPKPALALVGESGNMTINSDFHTTQQMRKVLGQFNVEYQA